MSEPEPRHVRRTRYPGSHPRKFAEKYKEHGGDPQTLAKVLAAGKTPAGAHRPIMVEEILEVLDPQPGEIAVDCTLGHGGHAAALLSKLQPGGRLLGLDVDPIEQPKTEARLRGLGFSTESLEIMRCNFAGLPRALVAAGIERADIILADLGVSSMQLDDPRRGFSLKTDGPLDMRMNPAHGQTASGFIRTTGVEKLAASLEANADEPNALIIAAALAGREIDTTSQLATAIRAALPMRNEGERDESVRRVFQALRIAINDEFSALDALLRNLPDCMKPGGRVAILTFHSGEDRRVKKAFQSGQRDGVYAAVSGNVIRASPAERHANPRSTAAKLRWARRA
jgi:16S rRNA (cytosine1402-N4)-methyltransferase